MFFLLAINSTSYLMKVIVLHGLFMFFIFYLNFFILSNKIIKTRMAWLNVLQILMLILWIAEK